jgi:superfamily II DNA/RNA helicase
MSSDFQSMGLVAPLLKAIADLGYTAPMPVQQQVIPAALAGGDWMVSSQTGSGKTAAYLLPALQSLINSPVRAGRGTAEPTVIVVCPTRELAQQVASDALDLTRQTRAVRVASIIGGMPYGKQIAQIKGANLVVATPGRLLDLCDRRAIRLDKVQCMVVDEADRMLDLGFADDLEAIHGLCRQRTQTLMFSATFATRIMRLAEHLMDRPGRIELAAMQDCPKNITQTLHWADDAAHRMRLLDHWLNDPAVSQAVVFANTQIQSEEIAERLRAKGFNANAMHGAMPQAVRQRRLESLRQGTTRILVATDVAARGIDVPNISHVINLGLPMKTEDYVHRIGRTGRAGRNGMAITLADRRDAGKIKAIERFTQQRIEASAIVGLEPKLSSARPASARRPGAAKRGAASFGKRPGGPRPLMGGADRRRPS